MANNGVQHMLADLGVKAESGTFDDNVYKEASTGRFIRHQELVSWIKNGCKKDDKPWVES